MRFFFIPLLPIALCLSLQSCDEGPVGDALDSRPNEEIKDAAEDTKDAVEDAAEGVKDAVNDATN